MLGLIAAAVVNWPMRPLDEVWARLYHDARSHDEASFAADRSEIARQENGLLTNWGARIHETYEGAEYKVTTFDGPAHVVGARRQSLYFAIFVPRASYKPPTFWELMPGFPPPGKTVWLEQEFGCRLETGDPVSTFPRKWLRGSGEQPPTYEDFKAVIAETAETGREFPATPPRGILSARYVTPLQIFPVQNLAPTRTHRLHHTISGEERAGRSAGDVSNGWMSLKKSAFEASGRWR